jgi:hypothetical protein
MRQIHLLFKDKSRFFVSFLETLVIRFNNGNSLIMYPIRDT